MISILKSYTGDKFSFLEEPIEEPIEETKNDFFNTTPPYYKNYSQKYTSQSNSPRQSKISQSKSEESYNIQKIFCSEILKSDIKTIEKKIISENQQKEHYNKLKIAHNHIEKIIEKIKTLKLITLFEIDSAKINQIEPCNQYSFLAFLQEISILEIKITNILLNNPTKKGFITAEITFDLSNNKTKKSSSGNHFHISFKKTNPFPCFMLNLKHIQNTLTVSCKNISYKNDNFTTVIKKIFNCHINIDPLLTI
jgi:hypothetical protein